MSDFSNTIFSLAGGPINYRAPSIDTSASRSISGASTVSLGSSYFAPYGLIKVSNDDMDSAKSFQLSPPHKGHHIHTNNRKKTDPLIDPLGNNAKRLSSLSDSQSSVVSAKSQPHLAKRDLRSIITSIKHGPSNEPIIIPKAGISRPKYFLDKIVDSYRSNRDVLLTDDIIMNHQIFTINSVIDSGSVKTNIIQEISELLQKFLVSTAVSHPKTSTIKSTLAYYGKLMDAFDVLDINKENLGLNSTDFNIIPQKQRTNDSSLSKELSNPKIGITAPKSKQKSNGHKKFFFSSALSSSFKKSSSHQSLYSKHWRNSSQINQPLQEQKSRSSTSTVNNNHSRTMSVSTIATTESSRSARDQVSINEYFFHVEYLQVSVSEIYDHYYNSNDEELCHKLNLIVQFLNDYIVKFIVNDILALSVSLVTKIALETFV